MCQGVKISVDKGDEPQKVKGSHETAPPPAAKAPRVNPLVIGPAPAAAKSGGGLKVPGLG